MDIYARDGRPIDMTTFNELLADPAARRVALEEVGPYVVSTVWLGLDHNWHREGRPLIFETMVFATDSWHGDAPMLEFDCRRYSTEEEARTGHDETVLVVRATTDEVGPTSGA